MNLKAMKQAVVSAYNETKADDSLLGLTTDDVTTVVSRYVGDNVRLGVFDTDIPDARLYIVEYKLYPHLYAVSVYKRETEEPFTYKGAHI